MVTAAVIRQDGRRVLNFETFKLAYRAADLECTDSLELWRVGLYGWYLLDADDLDPEAVPVADGFIDPERPLESRFVAL